MEKTLQDVLKTDKSLSLTPEDYIAINKRLLVMLQLSTLASNMAFEIEQIYRKKSSYKMNIKHNHERLKSMIRQNINYKFWETLTQEQIDATEQDADTLEQMVYEWAGLKLL